MPLTHGAAPLRRFGGETALKNPKKVAFVPGHATLAVLSASGVLQLVPLAGGHPKSVAVATPSTALRTHLAVSPKGDRVLAGRFAVDPDGKKLWTASTSSHVRHASVAPELRGPRIADGAAVVDRKRRNIHGLNNSCVLRLQAALASATQRGRCGSRRSSP